ncbi:hypothetical protein GCM10009603_46720 [Nocardiopsis exhalans]
MPWGAELCDMGPSRQGGDLKAGTLVRGGDRRFFPWQKHVSRGATDLTEDAPQLSGLGGASVPNLGGEQGRHRCWTG